MASKPFRPYFIAFASISLVGSVLAQPVPASPVPASPPADGAAAVEAADVNVAVDPRIELLLIVQHLTGDYEQRTNLITNFDFAYKREIEERFRPFAMHTVVATYRAMALRGFSFDGGPQAMLHLTADERLSLRGTMPDDLLKRVGGPEQFEVFRQQVADFAKSSGFWEFFAGHQPLYDELCKSVLERARPADLVAALNAYTGMQVVNARLVLFPLGHPGGFAARVTPMADGVEQPMEVFAVVGPGGAIEDKPVFGGPAAPWFESLVIHEFAHTIVNPLAQAHALRVAQSAAKLDPIRPQMSRQAYQNWETVVNEHIVRAIEARLALKLHGMSAGTAKMNQELKRGFVFIPGLVQALARYEEDRTKWPTLADFYPKLLAVFEAEANRTAQPPGKAQPESRPTE